MGIRGAIPRMEAAATLLRRRQAISPRMVPAKLRADSSPGIEFAFPDPRGRCFASSAGMIEILFLLERPPFYFTPFDVFSILGIVL